MCLFSLATEEGLTLAAAIDSAPNQTLNPSVYQPGRLIQKRSALPPSRRGGATSRAPLRAAGD